MADLKMSYDAMTDMAGAFHTAQDQCSDTLGNLDNICSMLEGGALLGKAGDRLAAALHHSGKRALKNALSKLAELEGDINGAMADIQAGDTSGAGLF
jgi:uncharacterized protein YukE